MTTELLSLYPPIQVRGEKLDARTDLFSFGMVLYEMATGRRAFTGDTAPVLREAILTHSPAPPRELNPELPSELEKIINRALEKDREARYQSASEMRAALKSITASGVKVSLHNRWVVAAAGAFALLLVATIAWFTTRQPWTRSELKLRQLTVNSFENPVTSGAISPDGKYLAYTDTKRLFIKLNETGETQAVPQPDALGNKNVEWEAGPWFPDSTRFLSNAHSPGADPSTSSPSRGTSVWMVSVLGGAPRKMRDNAVAYSFSPDGSLISFGTNKGRVGDREIWLMGPSGEQERRLYETNEDSSIGSLNWSGDGQRVIYVKTDRSGDTLVSRDLKGGTPNTLLSPSEMERVNDFRLLPDGRLIYSVAEPESFAGSACNFWEMRLDGHTGNPIEKPRRLTSWSGFCMSGTSVTADGKRLAFLKWAGHLTSYMADLVAGGTRILRPRHFPLSESSDGAADWTPDSKAIILASNRAGDFGIYKQSLDEDTAEPLVTGVTGGYGRNPCVSPDGKWVLYLGPQEAAGEPVMRVPISGGPSQLLFTAKPDGIIRCARSSSDLCAIAEPIEDRKQVIITTLDPLQGRGLELARFDIDSNEGHWWFDLSPDGTRIAATPSSAGPIYILSLRGQAPQQIQVKDWNNLLALSWAAGGKDLFVVAGIRGGRVLLHVDLQGNAHVLWENAGGSAETLAVPSPDGRHIAMQGWTTNGNMWMLENF